LFPDVHIGGRNCGMSHPSNHNALSIYRGFLDTTNPLYLALARRTTKGRRAHVGVKLQKTPYVLCSHVTEDEFNASVVVRGEWQECASVRTATIHGMCNGPPTYHIEHVVDQARNEPSCVDYHQPYVTRDGAQVIFLDGNQHSRWIWTWRVLALEPGTRCVAMTHGQTESKAEEDHSISANRSGSR